MNTTRQPTSTSISTSHCLALPKRKYLLFAITAVTLLGAQMMHATVLDLSSAMTDANSLENATNTDPKAFDGDINTRWATRNTDGDNAWIWVDLGSDFTLQSVDIQWETADATTYRLFSLTTAEASNISFAGDGNDTIDNINFTGWTEIASVDDAVDGANNDIDSFDFINETVTLRGAGTGSTTISLTPSVRYLLINPIADKDINGGASIWEVTVTVVPEPSAFALLAGMFGLTWVMLRRRG
jgi:hypothetical protein